ncbi:helix-turn-helix domain-containing protein [Saccharolobus islandicus]|uniref:Bacterio-opsin activator HTH domain protein n=1 Tax=Saccharolobus islandicus (strain REY15A) TaxID=930945 RepID=F0NDV0_SACI5|nr:helix-turn-helix domain-containing protein [Sulfolobus islandicus]ADX84659.1 Bacterio-opsin activator HTH domain protein [Sulfolobus islandicus REY15A]
MEKFSVLSIDLFHPDCWTSITDKYEVNVKLISQNFSDSDFFSSRVLILGRDSKKLINEMRNSKNVKVIKVYSMDRGAFLVDFIYPKRNAISNLLHEINSIVISHRIIDGTEKWNIVVSIYSIPKILESLKKASTLINFKEIKLSELRKLMNKLTDRNMEILKIAYERGLFDYPRQCKLTSISNETGIKPNTLLYHIRKAEKLLLEILLDEYYSLL